MYQLFNYKIIYICSLLICLSLNSFAQLNLRPAEVILSDGTTLQVLIDYQYDDKSPEAFFFRKDENAKIESLTPEACKMVKVANAIFISEEVNVETSPRKVALMIKTNEPDFQYMSKRVFLQYVIKGEKNLLMYISPETGVQNFYIKKGDTIEHLGFKQFIEDKNGKKMIRTNNKFRTQLLAYLSDCADLSSTIMSLPYKRSALKKTFITYMECKGLRDKLEVIPKDPISTRFGVLAGITHSSINMERSFSNISVLRSSTKPTGGLFFDCVFPKASGKISINNELILGLFSFIDTKTDEFGNTTEQFDENVKITQIKLHNHFRLNFSPKENTAFFKTGVSWNYSIIQVNEYNRTLFLPSGPLVTEAKAFKNDAKFRVSPVFAFGYQLNKISLEARGELSSFSGDNRFWLLAAYSFN